MKSIYILLLAAGIPILLTSACERNVSVTPALPPAAAASPTPTILNSPTFTATPTVTSTPLPALYLALGDSISYGSDLTNLSLSFVNLLHQNNNSAYPADAGKDLASKYPGTLLQNLAIPGARSFEVINNEMPSVPQGNASPVFVTLLIGGNELITSCGASPCDGADYGCTAAQGTTWSYNFKSRLENQIVKVLQNTSLYPRVQKIVLGNIYDTTDGTGLSAYGWADGELVLAQYNLRIAEVAADTGVDLVDIYGDFLGHGTQYNNTGNPYYDPADPTFWYVGAFPIPIHPNDRGHYELKNLFWPRF